MRYRPNSYALLWHSLLSSIESQKMMHKLELQSYELKPISRPEES
jgi:hypothetical protein